MLRARKERNRELQEENTRLGYFTMLLKDGVMLLEEMMYKLRPKS